MLNAWRPIGLALGGNEVVDPQPEVECLPPFYGGGELQAQRENRELVITNAQGAQSVVGVLGQPDFSLAQAKGSSRDTRGSIGRVSRIAPSLPLEALRGELAQGLPGVFFHTVKQREYR